MTATRPLRPAHTTHHVLGGHTTIPRETVRHRRVVQIVAVVALGVTLSYLVWRTTQTLDLSAWWLSLPMLLLEMHAGIGLALHTFSLWNVDHRAPAPVVDASDAAIAVLIPTYNEPEEVLLPTVTAAVALEPRHETWVLDDGDRPHIRALAESLGARYLARPEHDHAKAGNLNYALGHVEADIVAILDADHVAGRGFLTRTLGYFDDPTLALVQTPQDFYNEDSFEEVDAAVMPWNSHAPSYHEQSMFYRAIQPGKNRWGAAFWCGTGAVLRVSALREIGGVATGSVTEDIQTTIRLQRAGWRTVYHNEVLVRGLAAATVEQYALQRHRWCAGAMQVLRRERPFTGRGLTVVQRLSYAATLLGWFDAWRTLGYLLLPIAVLATGVAPLVADWRAFMPWFLGSLLLQQTALRVLGRGFSRSVPAVVFELVRMTPTLRATTSLVHNKPPVFRVTPKGRAEDGATSARAPRLLLALLALSFVAAGWYAATFLGLTPITYSNRWVVHGAFFWLAVNTALLGAAVARTRDARFAGERRASFRFAVQRPVTLDGRAATLLDVSLTGARVRVPASSLSPAKGDHCILRLHLDDGPMDVECTVAAVDTSGFGDARLGLSFAQQRPEQRARLTLWAFGLQAPSLAARPGTDTAVVRKAA